MENDLNYIKSFLKFPALRSNLENCEITGIGVLKNVNVALCGMKNVHLTKESIRILEVHISYNKKIQDDLSFCKTIQNLCNVIKLWRESITLRNDCKDGGLKIVDTEHKIAS